MAPFPASPTDILKKIFAVKDFYTAIKMLGWDALFIKWIKGFLHEENDHFVALASKQPGLLAANPLEKHVENLFPNSSLRYEIHYFHSEPAKRSLVYN